MFLAFYESAVKLLSRVWLFVTAWTVAYQAPSPGNLPYPGNEPRSPTLQADSLLSESPGNPLMGQGISKCTSPDIINTSARCEMCKGSTKPGTILNQNFGLVILKLQKVTLLALIHVRTVLGLRFLRGYRSFQPEWRWVRVLSLLVRWVTVTKDFAL